MKAKAQTLLLIGVALSVNIANSVPPSTLLIGGGFAGSTGYSWVAFGNNDSTLSATGATQSGFWVGDAVAQWNIGDEVIVGIAREANAGSLGHTGYYAIVNHVLTGDDPAEFNSITARVMPSPGVQASNVANLSWSVAVADPGENNATNIAGYVVYRSTNGILFDPILGPVTGTNATDAILNDTEYYYALGLVFRGTPPVTSTVLSANSARVFKDSDVDGLPDYFELANGLDANSGAGTNGPAGDADGDSMANFEEWIAGTTANSPTSYLFAKNIQPSGAGVEIRWDGIGGRSYTLARSAGLPATNWSAIHGPLACYSNVTMIYTDAVPAQPAFYRLQVQKN